MEVQHAQVYLPSVNQSCACVCVCVCKDEVKRAHEALMKRERVVLLQDEPIFVIWP